MAVTATRMSGRTWHFNMSPTSTIGELRRRAMLASGGMQKVDVLVDTTRLDGEKEHLRHVEVQGLSDGVQLTLVLRER